MVKKYVVEPSIRDYETMTKWGAVLERSHVELVPFTEEFTMDSVSVMLNECRGYTLLLNEESDLNAWKLLLSKVQDQVSGMINEDLNNRTIIVLRPLEEDCQEAYSEWIKYIVENTTCSTKELHSMGAFGEITKTKTLSECAMFIRD